MATITDRVTGETFPLITRAEANLRPPRKRVRIPGAPRTIFAHHTVTATGPAIPVWRQVQAFHMDTRGWSDVAYSFAYTTTGLILEGRGWGIVGGHTEGHNSTSHAFVFLGNSDRHELTDPAKRAFWCLLREAEHRYGPQTVRRHRDVAATGCPGAAITRWITAGHPYPHHQEDDDMTDELRKRLDAQDARLDRIEKLINALAVGPGWGHQRGALPMLADLTAERG